MIARLLISSCLERRVEEINKILAGEGFTPNHPDLLYLPYDSKLGITEARKIKQHFSLKPYSSRGRAVVLEDASKLTLEAQSALLKTLEELPENAIFILGADSDSKLLPTVLSRCQIVHIDTDLAGSTHPTYEVYVQEVEKLLNSSIEEIEERFEYIEKLKDREEFLKSIVSYFHQNLASHIGSGNTDHKEFLKELLEAEKWANQNVNIRAILEYLMLVMPSKLW